jgi:hypothetical protein
MKNKMMRERLEFFQTLPGLLMMRECALEASHLAQMMASRSG